MEGFADLAFALRITRLFGVCGVRKQAQNALVAEARKLSSDGNYNYTSLDTLSGLITDSKPAEDICEAAEDDGVEIILP